MASVYDRCFALTGRPESTSGIADVAGHGLGRLNWVDSCPPKGRSGTAGVGVKGTLRITNGRE
jgi:hypothetical protein